jgi:hypothetical protein
MLQHLMVTPDAVHEALQDATHFFTCARTLWQSGSPLFVRPLYDAIETARHALRGAESAGDELAYAETTLYFAGHEGTWFPPARLASQLPQVLVSGVAELVAARATNVPTASNLKALDEWFAAAHAAQVDCTDAWQKYGVVNDPFWPVQLWRDGHFTRVECESAVRRMLARVHVGSVHHKHFMARCLLLENQLSS